MGILVDLWVLVLRDRVEPEILCTGQVEEWLTWSVFFLMSVTCPFSDQIRERHLGKISLLNELLRE